jgi:SAM-dependent methyltransferase
MRKKRMATEKTKLNIGCGQDIKEDYVNMDFVKGGGVDVVHNLDKTPWPFKENTFEEVYASHVLEHIGDLTKIMKEIRRVSKNGAKIVIRVPHFSCGVGYRDPTHKRLFSYFTMEYFANPKNYYERPESNWFVIKKRKLNFTRLSYTWMNLIFNPLINLSPEMYERFCCWTFPCSEVIFELEVAK